MSLPTLNSNDYRAPASGDDTARDQPRQPQPAPDHSAAVPTMNSTGPRLAGFDAHWASLPSGGQPLNGVPAQAHSEVTIRTTANRAGSLLRQTVITRDTHTTGGETPDSLWEGLQEVTKRLTRLEHAHPAAAQAKAISKTEYDADKERYQLARAIEANDLDGVTRIVEKHPRLLRKRSADGRTPLGHAACNGSGLMVSNLILLESRLASRGTGEKSCLTLRDSAGKAPIHHAIDAGQWKVFELLLEAGTPLDVRTVGKHIPLLAYAAGHGATAVTRVLQCLPTKLLNHADDLGRTAIHNACIHNDPDSLGMLLKAGCRAFLADSEQMTPLHFAAKHKDTACLAQLLAAASASDIDAATCDGNTALHLAATAGNVDATRLLCKSRASLDLPNHDEWTPLACAADEGHLAVMSYLVKQRARIMPGENFWAWPITRALKNGDWKGVEILRTGKGKDRLQFNAIRFASNAAKTGNAVMFEACLKGHTLMGEPISTRDVPGLLGAAINGGSPEVMGLLADFFKKVVFGNYLNDMLARAFVTAQKKGKFDCLLPLARRLKHLALRSETLNNIVASAQARKDYVLLDALAKIKIVVDGDKLTAMPDALLPDPLARELLNPAKVPKRSLATVFRKPKLPRNADIDATNTVSQLALDVTSIDPSTAIAATLTAQKISALLHQPVANSLIPLCTAFATAGNLKLSQAQYIMGYGLAKYVDQDHLPLPANLDKLSGAQAMLEKCHAHREALAEAGIAMLEMADGRINEAFIHALALITIATPGMSTSTYATAIADKLATDLGLLPIWAARLAKVCCQASASVIPAYSGSFNTDQPPADLMAKLEASILEKFAEEMKLESAPEGFREASLAIDPGVLTDFNELLWRQWDKICEAMADSVTDTGPSVSEEVTADHISDADSDVLVSSASDKEDRAD